jgi:5-methylthioadenosine/S-adenosylhomocysteine deaminase
MATESRVGANATATVPAIGATALIDADVMIVGANVWPSWDSDVIVDGVVAVRGDRIVAVGPASMAQQVSARTTLSAPDSLVTPGLIDAHTHLALSGARGATWRGGHPVYDVFWPLESRLTHEHVAAFAAIGAAESLLNGTTCVNDHYFFADAVAESVIALGLRAVVGECVMTTDGPWAGEGRFAVADAFTRRWHGAHPLISVAVAPHAPDTVDDNTLRALGELAAELDVPLHLHLSQTAREVTAMAARRGLTPIQHVMSLRLAATRILAAHCTYLADGDLELLADSAATTAVFCPTVHGLDGKVLPAADLLADGGRVAIGTDAAPNERRSVHHELSIASVLQGALTGRGASAFPPAQSWRAGTMAGASALGVDAGELRVGALADIVVWRLDQPNVTPLPDPAVALVFAMGSGDVDRVMVGGSWRVIGGELVDVDVQRLRASAEQSVRAVLPNRGGRSV